MTRLAVWIVSTTAGVVLLFSYHTSTSGAGGGGRVVSGGAPVGVVTEPPAAPSSASPSPAGRSPAAQPTARTVNGTAVDTRFGPVQVQIKVTGHRIVSADAITYPTESGRDQEINSYAIPQLDGEALQAQSARIDTVSGATYTSVGYQQSLQSAIDAAHL